MPNDRYTLSAGAGVKLFAEWAPKTAISKKQGTRRTGGVLGDIVGRKEFDDPVKLQQMQHL